MQEIVSDLTDSQIRQRMQIVESNILKIQDALGETRSGTVKAQFLIKRYHTALLFYADVIHEAAYRKMITLH